MSGWLVNGGRLANGGQGLDRPEGAYGAGGVTAVDLKASAAGDRLAQLVVQAGRDVAVQAPEHPERAKGWSVVWGEQLDVRIVRRGLDSSEITEATSPWSLRRHGSGNGVPE